MNSPAATSSVQQQQQQQQQNGGATGAEWNGCGGLRRRLRCQRERIDSINAAPLQLGEQFALVSKRWYDAWRDFVALGDADSGCGGGGGDAAEADEEEADDELESRQPGPVDNSDIVDAKGELLPHLLPEMDLVCWRKEAWDLAVAWYGVRPPPAGCQLLRPVIRKGKFAARLEIEVYGLHVRAAPLTAAAADDADARSRVYSRADTFADVEADIRQLLRLPSGADTRLWVSIGSDPANCRPVDDISAAIGSQVYSGQWLLLETRGDDGKWPKGDSPTGSSTSPSRPAASEASSKTTTAGGACGLNQLGNTCFMNAAVQALSNVPPLTDYLLSSVWAVDLNRDNPLGKGGEIARTYAELIGTMWSGRCPATTPRAFKTAVGKFAPQFSGYQQHDCQELLAFLLDGLHEDLNRIRKKPYVELKDADGRPDRLVADEAWRHYKMRNDSVIVDLFHGQLKSTLVCPECEKVSVTFDPFCHLSLPVPKEQERQFVFHLSPADPLRRAQKCKLIVPADGEVSALCAEIGRRFGVAADRLLLADVFERKFHRVFRRSESYGDVSNERDCIFAYELDQPLPSDEYTVAKVYFSLVDAPGARQSRAALAAPVVATVPRRLSHAALHRAALARCRRFLRFVADEEDGGDKDEDEGKTSSLLSSLTLRRCNATMTNFAEAPIDANDEQRMMDLPEAGVYLTFQLTHEQRQELLDEREAVALETDASSLRQAPPQRKRRLQDCLKLFTEQEVLGKKDAWLCPSCKNYQRAKKKFDIWRLPRVLVMHLKRFHYDRIFRRKIEHLVDFPIEGLDLSEWVLDKEAAGGCVYNLAAVANHYGGLGCGHYTAFGRNCRTGRWLHFDDASVTACSSDQVVTKAAYVLVYIRDEAPPSNGLNSDNGQEAPGDEGEEEAVMDEEEHREEEEEEDLMDVG